MATATEISPATFLQANPTAAKRLAGQWFDFALRHREIEDFGSKEQLDAWLKTHPDIRVDSKQLWYGKQLGETYFAMQEQHEQSQMQTGEGIDTDHNLSELAGLIALPIALLYKPKLMEDDHGYQKIEEKKKEEWLKTNNKKDFNSKEGLDYLYGSLDNPETPTLRQEAEAAFRENPKNAKKLARYDKEKKAFYKNLDSDPAIARLKETVNEHTYARYELLKQTDKTITPEQVQKQVEEKAWERFVQDHPEKAQAYSQEKYNKHNQDIKAAVTRVEKRKKEQAIAEETRQMVSHKTHKEPPPPSIPILIPPIHPPSPSGLIDTQGRPLSSSHPAPTHTQPPHVQRPMPQSRTTSLINNANRLASMLSSDNSQGGGKSLIDRGNDAYDTYRKAQSAIRAARTGVQMARTAVSAVRGAVLLANPYTWIVIGTIAAIILIVVIITIILKSGEGGDIKLPKAGTIPGLTIALAGPVAVENGKDIGYGITIVYAGPLDVIISNPIPSNTTYVDSAPPGAKIENNVVSWHLKEIKGLPAQKDFELAIQLRPINKDVVVRNQVFANTLGSVGNTNAAEFGSLMIGQGRNVAILGNEDAFVAQVIKNGGSYNLSNKEARIRQLYKVAAARNVNPLILLTTWGTEQGFGQEQRAFSCPKQVDNSFTDQLACAVGTWDNHMTYFEKNKDANGNVPLASQIGNTCIYSDPFLYAAEKYGPRCVVSDANENWPSSFENFYKQFLR